MKVSVKNTSRYPDSQVCWLMSYAANYVIRESVRGKWPSRYTGAILPYHVEFKNKTHARYGGLAYWSPIRINGELHRHVLVKVGSPDKFPLENHVDRRYKDMPGFSANDWQECAVAIAAHEMAHTFFPGGKEGEFNCDLIMDDAVNEFRKERALFDEFVANEARRTSERQQAIAAKRSPQAVNATALAKATAKLEQWSRKQKLAGTKVKHYSRLVKRLNNRANALAGSGVQS